MKDGLIHSHYESMHAQLKSKSARGLANFHKLIVNGYLLLGLEKQQGNDIGKDQMHWWIFKKEKDLSALERDTSKVLPAAKKMKDDARRLRRGFELSSYQVLISALNKFVTDHESEILLLYKYVKKLARKNVVAPGILFTYRVWGTTQQWDRTSVNKAGEVTLCDDARENLETSLGLLQRSRPTAAWEASGMRNESDMDDSSFEKYLRSSNGARKWLRLTSDRVLESLEDYWDNVLQSLRNVQLDISLRMDVENLVTNPGFWSASIRRMMDYVLEDQLWDFKETLAMWHTSGDQKRRLEVGFCERIAAFANAHGGAMVIGISDKVPRKIVGLSDPENQVKHVAESIARLCDYKSDFTRMIQVRIRSDGKGTKMCLVVAVKQTRAPVGVMNIDGRYSYPQRLGTGIVRADRATLLSIKSQITTDNFNFVGELHRITFGGFISFSYGQPSLAGITDRIEGVKSLRRPRGAHSFLGSVFGPRKSSS